MVSLSIISNVSGGVTLADTFSSSSVVRLEAIYFWCVPRYGDKAFLVLFLIAGYGGGQLRLDLSDTYHCPDSYSPLILS